MRIFGGLLMVLGLLLLIVPGGFIGSIIFSEMAAGRPVNFQALIPFIIIFIILGLPPALGGYWLAFKRRPGSPEVASQPAARAVSAEPQNVMQSIGSFDVSRLNALGWLLMLAVTALFFTCVAGLVAILQAEQVKFDEIPRGIKTAGGLGIFVAIAGAFVAGKWILAKLGMSIYRAPSSGEQTT